MDNLFQKSKRRHIRELNVVPILDMMTTLIIFLLQITSFMEFTKITIPPSSTSVITDPVRPPPLSPKIFLMANEKASSLKVQLMWAGESSGANVEIVKFDKDSSKIENAAAVLKAVDKLVNEFRKEFPGEQNFQLGASSSIPYQHVVSAMDGIQAAFGPKTEKAVREVANIVLVSYQDVNAEYLRSGEVVE